MAFRVIHEPIFLVDEEFVVLYVAKKRLSWRRNSNTKRQNSFGRILVFRLTEHTLIWHVLDDRLSGIWTIV
jgi:hypothetical protein